MYFHDYIIQDCSWMCICILLMIIDDNLIILLYVLTWRLTTPHMNFILKCLNIDWLYAVSFCTMFFHEASKKNGETGVRTTSPSFPAWSVPVVFKNITLTVLGLYFVLFCREFRVGIHTWLVHVPVCARGTCEQQNVLNFQGKWQCVGYEQLLYGCVSAL